MAYFHAFKFVRLWECIKLILVESLRRLSLSHSIYSVVGKSIFWSILFAIELCFILPETLVFSTAAGRITISHWVHWVFTEPPSATSVFLNRVGRAFQFGKVASTMQAERVHPVCCVVDIPLGRCEAWGESEWVKRPGFRSAYLTPNV